MRNENDNVTKSSPFSSSSSSSNTISSSLGYGLLSAKLLQMSLGLSIMTASVWSMIVILCFVLHIYILWSELYTTALWFCANMTHSSDSTFHFVLSLSRYPNNALSLSWPIYPPFFTHTHAHAHTSEREYFTFGNNQLSSDVLFERGVHPTNIHIFVSLPIYIFRTQWEETKTPNSVYFLFRILHIFFQLFTFSWGGVAL